MGRWSRFGAKSQDLGPALRSFPITSIVGPKRRQFSANSDALTPPVPVAARTPKSRAAAGAPSRCFGARRNPSRSFPGGVANAPKLAGENGGKFRNCGNGFGTTPHPTPNRCLPAPARHRLSPAHLETSEAFQGQSDPKKCHGKRTGRGGRREERQEKSQPAAGSSGGEVGAPGRGRARASGLGWGRFGSKAQDWAGS